MRVSNVDKHTIEDELPVRLCNYVDVYYNDLITSALEFMRATASQSEVDRFRLQENDVLITKDSETWDDIGVPALVVVAMMISWVKPVNPSHPYLENDPAPSFDPHHLRISPWL